MSDYQRKFNRFELKYLLHHEQVHRLLEMIQPHVQLDAHGDEAGTYRVTSLYYDSPDLRCYWEKIDGEKYRRKVRVRTYGSRSDQAFVEIKQRYNLSVQKRRCRSSAEDTAHIMQCIDRGDLPPDIDTVWGEVYNLRVRQRLRPTIVISYQRSAYFDRYKKDLRITIDRDLRARNLDLDLFSPHRGAWFIPPTWMVLEVKFNEVVPRWICTCLNSMDLQVIRFSKYTAGIEHFGMQMRAAVS